MKVICWWVMAGAQPSTAEALIPQTLFVCFIQLPCSTLLFIFFSSGPNPKRKEEKRQAKTNKLKLKA